MCLCVCIMYMNNILLSFPVSFFEVFCVHLQAYSLIIPLSLKSKRTVFGLWENLDSHFAVF